MAIGAVLIGLLAVELREWSAARWLGRSTFEGPGRRQQLEKTRTASLVAAREQGSVLCGMMLRRTSACGRLEP